MAESQQGMNRGAQEPSSHGKDESNATRRPAQRVNFDEMNYEQRRAPYNSGARVKGDKKQDENQEASHNPRRENRR